MRRLMNGEGIDPSMLSQLSGMQVDPAMLQQMMAQLQQVFAGPADGKITWDATRTQALHLANQESRAIGQAQRSDLDQAFSLAELWVSDATTIAAPSERPRVISRGEWVEQTLPVWQEVAEPVATSIADALTAALREQVPEEMSEIVGTAGRLMRSVGGTLFASQLGQVIGKLSREVISGGDVGIPVMPAGHAVILPQNFAELGEGLEIPDDQLALFVAARELASARLFRHAKWLRLDVLSQIGDYARDIHVDTDTLEDLASRFDPSNPEELRSALESGALLPRQTADQQAALERLETLLALIEGWIDVVATDATSRVPSLARIAEATRRRRAVGGPAEDALGALVGLKIRPRRLREASMMWRTIGDAVGNDVRDSLWDYPDLIPTSADIDDPQALISRLQAGQRGETAEADEFDEALAQLLAGGFDTPTDETNADGDDDASGGEKPV
ncbi:MAG: zinc-dependent metalloprotease [Microbacterium sp.]